jgi:hypothetical protein
MAAPSKNPSIAIDTAALEQIEASSDGMVDLETAAMLMTDLHHKATAAMHSSQEAAEAARRGGLEMATSRRNGSAVLEPSVTYPSGAVSLPQVPWEAFMPQSVTERKAHSISSSASGSVDSSAASSSSQLSFTSATSATTVTPHPNQLPPIVERQLSAGDSLAPALQSLASSLPESGTATPGPYSPLPGMAGPHSPVDYRRSPAPASVVPKPPQVNSDDERDTILDNIRSTDTERAILDGFRLPNRQSLNRFLSTYFNLFHHHLPFLHSASFRAGEVAPPLLLAVLSIGALYSFDHEQAYMLHVGSKVLVNQFLQNKENFSSRKCPLWTMQSTLLNMVFASWSGDPKGLEWACSIKSLLANVSHLPNVIKINMK